LRLFFDSFEFSYEVLLYSEEDLLGFPVIPRGSGSEDDNFLFLLTQDQSAHFRDSQKFSQILFNYCLFYHDIHIMSCLRPCQELYI